MRIKESKYLRAIAAIILAFSMIISLSGCVRASSAWHKLVGNLGVDEADGMPVARRLNQVEMIQLLTGAVRGDQELTAYYNSISSKQLDGLSLDEFHQYIKLLRRGISGDVHSFTVMSEKELEEKKASMAAVLPDQQELIESSVGFWIMYRQTGRKDEQFAVYVQLDQDGQVYLSSEWVRQILRIASFANLYFDALDNEDREAFAYLINKAERSERVTMAKTDFLIDFYQNNISSRTSEYSLNEARLDRISYEQFGIINPDRSQSVSRTVAFSIDSSGEFHADDTVSNVIADDDLSIFYDGEPLFTLAARSNDSFERVWSYKLEPATGSPFHHDDTNCKPYVDGVDLINLNYNGLAISVQGDCQDHESWNGVVRSLSMIGPLYHTGSGLSPGQPLEEVLVRYPFAEESGFRLRKIVEGGTVTMTITIEEDIIKKIDMSLILTEQ